MTDAEILVQQIHRYQQEEHQFDLIKAVMEDAPVQVRKRARWHARPKSGVASAVTGGQVWPN